MLTSILTPLAPGGETPFLGIAVSYNYLLPMPESADPLAATLPVLKWPEFEVPSGGPAPLARTLTDALHQWSKTVNPPQQQASFSIALTLFAPPAVDGRMSPLLTMDRIDLIVPPGWPTT